MIVISSNIVYFILGFVSCIALIILLSIYLVNKSNRERRKNLEELSDFLNKIIDDNKKDE